MRIKGNPAEIVNHLFQTLLVTYLFLLLIEQIWQGIVSIYFNLNYLLIAVIVIGIVDVFAEHPQKQKENTTRKDYLFVFLLGIIGFAIIKYKTSELEWLSWLISLIAGILIVLLSVLVLEEDNESERY